MNATGQARVGQGRVRIWRVLWMSRCESKLLNGCECE